jgi:hypothetical protein
VWGMWSAAWWRFVPHIALPLPLLALPAASPLPRLCVATVCDAHRDTRVVAHLTTSLH